MRKVLKKNIYILLLVFMILVCIIFVLVWGITNSTDAEFFKISLYQLISIFIPIMVALIITYYLNQQKSDKRKVMDNFEKLLDKTQKNILWFVEIESFITEDAVFNEEYLMKLRYTNNLVYMLTRFPISNDTKKDINELNKIIINCTQVIENIPTKKIESKEEELKYPLKKNILQMDYLCEKIRCSLYKIS